MKRAGIVAASDEGFPIQNALVMTQAMEFCLQLDLPILAHCEDTTLTRGGSMNEGAMSAMLGLKGMPRSAEEIMVMRNCLLSLHTGCQLHIMRVSHLGRGRDGPPSEVPGRARDRRDLPDALPFTDENVGEFDTRFKIQPPLRTQVDIDLLLQALNDGTIDCIASDHRPTRATRWTFPSRRRPTAALSSSRRWASR